MELIRPRTDLIQTGSRVPKPFLEHGHEHGFDHHLGTCTKPCREARIDHPHPI